MANNHESVTVTGPADKLTQQTKALVQPQVAIQPPKCSGCDKPLDQVHETIYESYDFDSTTGTYIHDEWHDEMRMICPNCQEDLDELYPDGVCNFKTRLSQCQNCRKLWHDVELNSIKDLDQRVSPGEPVPSGECPDCGALCQQISLPQTEEGT